MPPKKQRFFTHLRKIQILAALCGIPGFLAAMILVYFGEYEAKVYMTIILLVGGPWFYFTLRLQSQLTHPLQTASNMLSALREGDFSLHPSYISEQDALGQLMLEIKLLTNVLAEHRMDAMEAHSLLDKILEEVDAAVIAFDPERKITLANPAALSLLGQERDSLINHYAAEFHLDPALDAPSNSIIDHPVDAFSGRFTVRQGSYRVDGQPHSIVILIDVSRSLRDEELLAWKRLIRVLGHEINNSMAPIRSLAQSLQSIAKAEPDEDTMDDICDGLDVIFQRSDSLTRFVHDYARLAKLPKPSRRTFNLLPIVERITSLHKPSDHIRLDPNGKDLEIYADPDQLEQALVNLIKNATEAAMETNGTVDIRWEMQNDWLVILIEDSGPGIANPDNLFIPFFSTKSGGSGIGLTLSRQIVEGHEGRLTLENKESGTGCVARLAMPASANPNS